MKRSNACFGVFGVLIGVLAVFFVENLLRFGFDLFSLRRGVSFFEVGEQMDSSFMDAEMNEEQSRVCDMVGCLDGWFQHLHSSVSEFGGLLWERTAISDSGGNLLISTESVIGTKWSFERSFERSKGWKFTPTNW